MPHLPALRSLALSKDTLCNNNVDMVSARALACVACAARTLELLRLGSLGLPPLTRCSPS